MPPTSHLLREAKSRCAARFEARSLASQVTSVVAWWLTTAGAEAMGGLTKNTQGIHMFDPSCWEKRENGLQNMQLGIGIC